MNLTNCPYVPGHELIREDMLTVFDATHAGLGKKATIWVYKMGTDSMAEITEHFHRQFSLAGAAYHPNVAEIFMGGVADQTIFTIQEPLLQTSLASVLAQKPPRDRETFFQVFNPLLAMLRSVSRLSLSIERVRLADIMVASPGHYRIQRWNPLSELDRSVSHGDKISKFANLPGLFYSEDSLDFDLSSRAIARWAYESVTAAGRSLDAAINDFQAVMKEKRKKTDPQPRFLPDVDPHVERFIYKLAMSKIQGGYVSIDDAIAALVRVRRGETLEEWPQPSSAGLAAASAVNLFADSAVASQPVATSTFSTTDYSAAVSARTRERRNHTKLLLAILGGLIVIAGAYFAFLKFFHINKPPIAEIVLLKTTAKVHEKVLFDGSRSSDPDGDILQYHWNIAEPGDISTHYFISRNRRPSAIDTTIQFFRPGTYKVSLYVSDGSKASEHDYVTIVITE